MTGKGYAILGAPELSRQLDQLGDALAGPVATGALQAAGIVLQREWKEAIANYPLIDTGSYLRSVNFEIVRDASGLMLYVGTDIVDPPYPFFLEYGTSKMEAKVHVRPAMDRAEPLAIREIEEVFRTLVERYR